jgi:Zn-dependent peptidase ImmA (M78 family)/transcriptional regulator with XRE-family HTH domain
MVDLATLGQRLKEARQNCGITQETAAQAIGVPRTAIVHVESGNRSISTLELTELARLYGRPVGSFLGEEEEKEDFLVAIHRLSPEGADPEKIRREVLHWVALCKEGVHLETLLDRKQRVGPPAYDLPTPDSPYAAIEQAEWVAEEERNRIGLGAAPIPDMAELLSGQGIWASGAHFSEEMSGLFLHHPSFGLVVLVKYDHPRGRKRFSYAHEYAHALLDRKRPMTITSKSNASELIEKRANAFAASFLVPKAAVELFLSTIRKGGGSRRTFFVYDVATEEGIEAERRTVVSSQEITYQDVALLAAHFGVSYQVIAYRLSDLAYVNRDELNTLLEKQEAARIYLKIIGRLKEVAGKPSPADREITSQLLPLVLEAYRREEISKGKLLDLSKQLGIKGSELATLA